VIVTLVSKIGEDTDVIVLTETTDSSGVFSNLYMQPANSGWLVSDTIGRQNYAEDSEGILVGDGDTITVMYEDYEFPTQDTNVIDTLVYQPLRQSSIRLVGDTNSTMEVYVIGVDKVYIEVIDENRNDNPLRKDTFYVTITSAIGLDTEVILLTETLDTSWTFGNTVTVPGGVGIDLSDTLGVEGNADDTNYMSVGDTDILRVEYVDEEDISDTSSDTALTDQVFTEGYVYWTDSGQIGQDTYYIGDLVYVVLSDYDRNNTPRDSEVYSVTVQSVLAGDSEIYLLTEINDTEEIFTNGEPWVIGWIISDTIATVAGDGIITDQDRD